MPRYEYVLDLRSPFADRERPRVAIVAGDVGVIHEAIATVQLGRRVRDRIGGLGGDELAHGGLPGERLAVVVAPAGVVDDGPGDVRVAGHIGHCERDRLMSRELLSERAPRLDVVERRVEAPLSEPDRDRREGDASPREEAERVREPAALLPEQGVGTDVHVVERDRVGVARPPTHLAVLGADRGARRVARHDECRDPGAVVVPRGAREDDEVARQRGAGVRDELLRAVEHPAAVRAARGRRHPRDVGPAAGLGDRGPDEHLPLHHLRDQVLALALGAHVRHQPPVHPVRVCSHGERAVDARELLEGDGEARQLGAVAAVLHRDHQPEHAESGELPDELGGEAPLPVAFDRPRRDALDAEPPQLLTPRALLVARAPRGFDAGTVPLARHRPSSVPPRSAALRSAAATHMLPCRRWAANPVAAGGWRRPQPQIPLSSPTTGANTTALRRSRARFAGGVRMRAAVLRGEAGSGDLVVTDVPVPAPGPGEVLVRVLRTGICGSDVHFVLDGRARPAYTPIVLGHESVGVVEALGEGVTTPAPGTRVSVVPLITCGVCPRCRRRRSVICRQRACLGCDVEGSFAELLVVPARNLLPVPEALADEFAAVATDSVATAYHAVATRGRLAPGDSVVVWGVGGLGLSAVGVARALGAAEIVAVDPRAEARAWALETGADVALAPEEALDHIRRAGGADVAFEFVGSASTVEQAVRSLDDGGRAVVVGVGPEHVHVGRLMTFVLREREVLGSYGAEPEEVRDVLDLMATGRLHLPRVVGDVIPLGAIVEGMQRVQAGETGGSRIVIDVPAP